MANSKHAHYRHNILDKCFRRRSNPYTFKELLEKVNEEVAEVYPDESIAERTLRLDIQLFRDEVNGFVAPLKTVIHKGNHAYVYTAPDFSIGKQRLLPD